MKKATFEWDGGKFQIDFDTPIDLSLPIRRKENVNAFHLGDPVFETVRAGKFIGDVNEGGSCNVENISLSPHGNGTHTECVGHISKEHHSLVDCLKTYHFSALLISVHLINKEKSELAIKKEQIEEHFQNLDFSPEALIIRTIPNDTDKRTRFYSGTNPPYMSKNAIDFINKKEINHLLIDLPSLDHEDDPHLPAHHSFFNYPDNPQKNKTITELIYVPNEIKDGIYLLNLQVISLESDASPSKPVIFQAQFL